MKSLIYTLKILTLFVFAIPLSSQTTYWVPVSGISDTSWVYSIHVKNNGTIIASTFYYYLFFNVYRSLDNGLTWHWNTFLPAYSIASTDDGKIFLGGDNKGPIPETKLGISTNNGDSWNISYHIPAGIINSILPISSSTILFSTYSSIYKNTDDSWHEFERAPDTAHSRVLARDSNGTIFAGTKNKGIYMSIDEGTNWWSIPTVNIGCNNVKDISIIGSQYYFACTETSGVFRSTDEGWTWEPCDSGLTNRNTNSVTYSSDSVIYLGTNQGVFRSTNFGVSWTDFSRGLPPGTYITRVTSSPSGALYAGTVNKGLYKTQQLPKYFKGWNLVSLPFTVPDQNITALFPTASSHAFMYDTSYIEKSELTKGHGYWIKFDSTTPAVYTGSQISEDTINIKKGWNLIGSIATPVPVDSLVHTPSEMNLSGFYQFQPGIGYSPTVTLSPGYGYWVKSDIDGQVIISSKF